MDIVDTANEINEFDIQYALLNRPVIIKSYNGRCIWCYEEPITLSSAYCSKDCGDDHIKFMRKNK